MALDNNPTTLPIISWTEIKLEKLVGSGSFGKVYEGKWKGNTVAIKQLFLTKLSNDLRKEFEDICPLHRCRFPCILQLYGVRRRRSLCDGSGISFQRIAL
jgi:serine/threonine protein kinase